MGQSYKCSICDNELDSAADVGEVHQFCEECLEREGEEIKKYNQSDEDGRYSALRTIKDNQRRGGNL